MFRIKICGITRAHDAHVAADCGADAIGFNFFNKSRRFVEPDTARKIADSLPPNMFKVGVFVNHTPEEIAYIVDTVGLDCIQLHGDEPVLIFEKLPRRLPIIRAFRCGDDGLQLAMMYQSEARSTVRTPDAYLADADAGTEYGGTGKQANWEKLASHSHDLFRKPLILAGGLNPTNVAEAMAAVYPFGVDVASGVESSPGVKDAKLVSQFIKAAKGALRDGQGMRGEESER